jgi:hypothetical protein
MAVAAVVTVFIVRYMVSACTSNTILIILLLTYAALRGTLDK